jgi:hypothetical protein
MSFPSSGSASSARVEVDPGDDRLTYAVVRFQVCDRKRRRFIANETGQDAGHGCVSHRAEVVEHAVGDAHPISLESVRATNTNGT